LINYLAGIFRRYHFARQIYRVLKGIDSTYSIPQTAPIEVKPSRHEFNRLNLVIPSINREHFFGGAATALHLFNALLDVDQRLQARIILTDATPDKQDLERFPDYRLIRPDDDSDHRRQMLPAVSKYQRTIFTGPGDRFLATSWWTAFSVLRMINNQVALYGNGCRKMGYMIQDFEPGFYNWSTHYALAESTYRSEIQTIPIFNSKYLKDYFDRSGYTFPHEFVFDPRLNVKLKEYLPSLNKYRRERKILIYGRPSVARNCFNLIVEGLKIWAGRQPDASRWELISVGESHKTISIGPDISIRSLGKLSLEEYAECMLKGAVGISLMLSPHPSYPPLEMAHFGLLTLTNSFAGKNLSSCHENIYSIDDLTPDRLAEALAFQTAKFDQDPQAGPRGKSLMTSYLSDKDIFPFAGALYRHLF